MAKPKHGPTGTPRASASPSPRATPRDPENEDRKGGSPSLSKPQVHWLMATFNTPKDNKKLAIADPSLESVKQAVEKRLKDPKGVRVCADFWKEHMKAQTTPKSLKERAAALVDFIHGQ